MSSRWTRGRSLLTPGAPQSLVQNTRSLPWQSSCSVVIRAEDTGGTSVLRGSPTGRSRNRDKHPPPPHPRDSCPFRGRRTWHKTQPGSERAGEHTWWKREKAWPFSDNTSSSTQSQSKEEDDWERWAEWGWGGKDGKEACYDTVKNLK